MRDKFVEMFNLQNRLNIRTNGEKWIKGVTLQGRHINWYRCIYMEAAEASNSLNWKHWKDINSKDDMENVKVELVDIWHFMMSQAIVDDGLEEAINNSYELFVMASNVTYSNELSLIDALDKIIASSANKKLPKELFYRAVDAIDGFSMEDVYLLYIGKNCLNQFRQDNGYKDGLYIKMWNGEEDNVYMQSILNGNPNISYAELYAALKTKYKKVSQDWVVFWTEHEVSKTKVNEKIHK